MNSNIIKLVAFLFVGIVAAIYLGIGVSTAQQETLMTVAFGIGVATVLLMGRHVWLLIPLVTLSNLFFRWIPGNLKLTELGVGCTLAGGILLLLTRRIRYRPSFSLIHWLTLVFLILLGIGYVRNPTGLSLFGSASVGGRAYFSIALMVAGAVYMCGLRVSLPELLRARSVAIGGGLFTVLIQWMAFIPGMAYPLAIVFGTANYSFLDDPTAAVGEDSVGRNQAAVATGTVLSRTLVGFISPLRAIFFSKWTIILLLAIAGGMFSGFRSKLALVFLTLALGTYYWSGIRGVVVSAALGFMGIITLAFVNLILPLPAQAQRALSFLPGTWEARWVESGERSTDWRIEIWEEALLTDRWIKDKIWGDGLGFSKEELELQESVASGAMSLDGLGGLTFHQVSILINGDYHSGPISLVRAIGYIGMSVFALLLIGLGIAAHRLIRQTRRTPYYGFTVFFMIPIIIHPINWMFVYGSFATDAPLFLLHLGFFTFIRNNLPLTANHPNAPRVEEPSEPSLA